MVHEKISKRKYDRRAFEFNGKTSIDLRGFGATSEQEKNKEQKETKWHKVELFTITQFETSSRIHSKSVHRHEMDFGPDTPTSSSQNSRTLNGTRELKG